MNGWARVHRQRSNYVTPAVGLGSPGPRPQRLLRPRHDPTRLLDVTVAAVRRRNPGTPRYHTPPSQLSAPISRHMLNSPPVYRTDHPIRSCGPGHASTTRGAGVDNRTGGAVPGKHRGGARRLGRRPGCDRDDARELESSVTKREQYAGSSGLGVSNRPSAVDADLRRIALSRHAPRGCLVLELGTPTGRTNLLLRFDLGLPAFRVPWSTRSAPRRQEAPLPVGPVVDRLRQPTRGPRYPVRRVAAQNSGPLYCDSGRGHPRGPVGGACHGQR